MNKFKCGNCGAIRYEVDNVVAVKCMECDSSECYGPLKAQTAPVADDISFKLMQAASEIDRLRTVVSVYERDIDDLKEFLENR